MRGAQGYYLTKTLKIEDSYLDIDKYTATKKPKDLRSQTRYQHTNLCSPRSVSNVELRSCPEFNVNEENISFIHQA